MSISSLQLSLLLGKFIPTPAPREVMTALDSVSIQQSNSTSGFQLTFRLRKAQGLKLDSELLAGMMLQPGNRVVISVTLNATPRVLMDGIITHHEFAPGGQGEPVLTVTGEDISVMMDLYQRTMEFPGMGETEIALLILAEYFAYGVVPTVIPTSASLFSLPIDEIPQQSATDRQYLQMIAANNDYIFFVRPGPVPLSNIAYWGPVNRLGMFAKPLNVDMGPATNIDSINFSYNALAPTRVSGLVSDQWSESELPVMTITSLRLPPLASQPPLIFNMPFVRETRIRYQGSSWIEAEAQAQSMVDSSSDITVTASGTLDTLRYGDILMAPGLVGVRGAGMSYDGYYYMPRVSHQISRGQYKQTFTLTREGLGSLVQAVLP